MDIERSQLTGNMAALKYRLSWLKYFVYPFSIDTIQLFLTRMYHVIDDYASTFAIHTYLCWQYENKECIMMFPSFRWFIAKGIKFYNIIKSTS